MYCQFIKADWDGLKVHRRYVFWLDILKHDATFSAKEISEWIEISIDCYIPTPHHGSHLLVLLTLYIATIISSKYHRDATPEHKELFCDSRNHCERVPKEGRSNYAETTRRPVASQGIGSHDF